MIQYLFLITENDSTNWLYNSSCLEQISSNNFIDVSSDSSDETFYLHKEETLYTTTVKKEKLPLEEKKPSIKSSIKRKKKDKKKNTYEKSEYEKDVKNVYFEDKYKDKGNNTVKTLYSRIRPYYNIKKSSLGFVSHKQSKKHIYERYYVKNIDYIEKNKKKDTIIKKESIINSFKEEEIPSWHIKLEELQKMKTKQYNEKLTNNPNDIQLWFEYIEFQVYHIYIYNKEYNIFNITFRKICIYTYILYLYIKIYVKKNLKNLKTKICFMEFSKNY